MGRAGPLAIHDLVEVVRVPDVGRLQIGLLSSTTRRERGEAGPRSTRVNSAASGVERGNLVRVRRDQ